MHTALRTPPSFQLVLRLLPWIALVATTTALLVYAPRDGHYGLLLTAAPFLAAAVHGAHATAAFGAATFSLYAGVHVWLSDDYSAVWWIKIALVAAACAIAVLSSQARQRERALHRTRDIAAALQRELLPADTSGTSTVEVCHRYTPTDTQAGVGGDWFDVIPLSGARIALTIGDVVGHGIKAATLMGRLRTAVRTLADLDLPPDELLTRMDVLAARLGDADDTRDLSATCLYLVYDPVTRRATMASAGHTPPALRHPDGTVEYPELPEHPPLGMGDTAFVSTTATLDEGTVVALYTDGLLDLRRRSTEEAFAGLTRALADETQTLRQLCDHICDTIPSDADDDVALLLARVGGMDPARIATWELPADPEAVRRTRKAVAHRLESWDLEALAFTTELIATELVTNALVHAAAPISLRLIKAEALICEVADASHTAPHPHPVHALDESGRGLQLVARLSDRWGTRRTDTGKIVWAEQKITEP
jgi:serine phosphatase RsbU (regulator of sigma subunit)/anti-sigma regulatory factor (Ser/Thr protein kinase)